MSLSPYKPVQITTPYYPPYSKKKIDAVDEPHVYNSQWTKLRNQFINEHPNCARCGRTVDVSQQDGIVDHKKPVKVWPEGLLVWDNLQTLCKPCHAVKTLNDYELYPHVYKLKANQTA